MANIQKILEKMKHSPQNVSFAEACKVCEHYFGKARQQGSSHRVYQMPWQGDPRVNIQNKNGKAKLYQLNQILKAIQKLEGSHE